MNKPHGPFVTGQIEPVFTVMAGDDCLLHFEADTLTPKQRQDDLDNLVLTAMLQVALTYMGQAKDYVALHELFQDEPWVRVLQRYNQLFADLFGDVVPLENYRYYPSDDFYQAVASGDQPGELLGLYMVSGSNKVLHQDEAMLEVSRKVNSKMHFAATAPGAQIPVPATLVCKKHQLGDTKSQAFLDEHGTVMIKLQGLAGARNVSSVENLEQAQRYVAEFSDDIDVLLQERLPADKYLEMTVDLTITDQEVRVSNVRQILFAQGLWVGNYISDELVLTPRQQEVCVQVGEYVRALGYVNPRGLNCGIDFFVKGDDIVVIEINARLTGGLFPVRLIERLGTQSESNIAFIDLISAARIDDYLAFVERYAQADNGSNMRIVPMGFSPFVQEVEGHEMIYVWQVVVGDFDAFRALKNEVLGEQELPTVALINPPVN